MSQLIFFFWAGNRFYCVFLIPNFRYQFSKFRSHGVGVGGLPVAGAGEGRRDRSQLPGDGLTVRFAAGEDSPPRLAAAFRV